MKEVHNMACLSSEYLTVNENSLDDQKQHRSAMFNALVYSTSRSDLTGLLIATELGIENLPIFTLTEAKA
jgi:hypothetical protein